MTRVRSAMAPGRYRRRPMDTSTLLLLIVLASIAIGFVIAIVIVRSGRGRAVTLLAEVPGEVRRTMAATSLGQESLGASQPRGTGTLELTDTEVAFAQWRPSVLLRIPRDAITTVDTTRSHLDKTMTSDLLRITWTTDGAEDRVAFFVRDLDPWLADLGGSRTPPPDA